MVADRMRGDGGGGCRGGDVEQLWLAGHHIALPGAESDDCNQARARKRPFLRQLIFLGN